MPDTPEAKIRARVGAIGFSGLAGNNAVKTLSGGEKARLLLGIATFQAPHLVILDEPTNHLDIDSRAALIEAINDYPGAIILVSHDRYLLEACADRLWLVQGGRVAPFDGDLDDYRRHVLADGGRGNTVGAKSAARQDPVQARRAAAEKRAQTAPLRQRVTKAETDIAQLTRPASQTGRHARRRRIIRARTRACRRIGQDPCARCRGACGGGRGMAGGEQRAGNRLIRGSRGETTRHCT